MLIQSVNSQRCKIIFLCIMSVIIFCSTSLMAREFDESEVRTAVETWVRYVTADARPNAFIQKMEPVQIEGEVIAYIAHLADSGFCIAGTNDFVLPVYLYNPHGTYDPANPGYQYILWEIATRTKNMQVGLEERDPKLQQQQEALSERAAFWQDLMASRTPKRIVRQEAELAEPDSMVLNLTSTWHQGGPFNDQCPLHVNAAQRCVVGCVATAMSQIMYYWRWPNTGVGNADVDYEYRWRNNWDNEPLAVDPNIPAGRWAGRLQWTAVGGGNLQMNGNWDGSVLSEAQSISDSTNYRTALQNLYNRLNNTVTNWPANFGATTYQWNLMADNAAILPPGGNAAVATLCYHAGVAVSMDYGIRGSGAFTQDAADALPDHFRYDKDALYMSRDIDLMTNEIQWLRPVILRGYDPRHGAHAWVVYGYNKRTDPDRQFRMNMGWGGASDDWYSCDNIDCLDNDGNPDFNQNQGHVTEIAPADVVNFVGRDDMVFGDGSPDEPYRDIETAISLCDDGATLIFKAGSDNTLSGSNLIINRPLTLKGHKAIIRKE